MSKIILFTQEAKTDNSPNYNVAISVKQGEEDKLITVGAAWNKVAKSGNTFISVSLKKEKFVKEDGTVYPAAKFTHKGIEFPFASVFKTKADPDKVLLSLSRKDGEEYVNEFGSTSGEIVRGDDKAVKRIDIELNEAVEVVLDYGVEQTKELAGTPEQADKDFSDISASDIQF